MDTVSYIKAYKPKDELSEKELKVIKKAINSSSNLDAFPDEIADDIIKNPAAGLVIFDAKEAKRTITTGALRKLERNPVIVSVNPISGTYAYLAGEKIIYNSFYLTKDTLSDGPPPADGIVDGHTLYPIFPSLLKKLAPDEEIRLKELQSKLGIITEYCARISLPPLHKFLENKYAYKVIDSDYVNIAFFSSYKGYYYPSYIDMYEGAISRSRTSSSYIDNPNLRNKVNLSANTGYQPQMVTGPVPEKAEKTLTTLLLNHLRTQIRHKKATLAELIKKAPTLTVSKVIENQTKADPETIELVKKQLLFWNKCLAVYSRTIAKEHEALIPLESKRSKKQEVDPLDQIYEVMPENGAYNFKLPKAKLPAL